jgi:spore coat polysaccharide biosynthesis protein SpsF (cytidylyltransferase family)
MNVLAITQARTGSTRLPGKVLKKVGDQTLLEIHFERILKSKRIDQLLVATTIAPEDEAIAGLASAHGLPFYRGSIHNVLNRFYLAASPYQPLWMVRLTSDCPLIDPQLIDTVIEKALDLDVDYCSNTLDPTFPDGMDIEVFKFAAFERAWLEATLASDTEHVTPYIHRNSSFNGKDLFQSFNVSNPENYSDVRLTVDEASDFEVISLLIEKLGTDKGWKTYADYYRTNDLINGINKHIGRNEGYQKH